MVHSCPTISSFSSLSVRGYLKVKTLSLFLKSSFRNESVQNTPEVYNNNLDRILYPMLDLCQIAWLPLLSLATPHGRYYLDKGNTPPSNGDATIEVNSSQDVHILVLKVMKRSPDLTAQPNQSKLYYLMQWAAHPFWEVTLLICLITFS